MTTTMEDDSLSSTSTMVAWLVTAVVAVLVSYYLKSSSNKKNHLPPTPRQGFWEVFHALYSGNSPYFLMSVARDVSKVYTLPLLFGKRIIVVADAKVARRILDHVQSPKWVGAYRFLDRVAGGSTFFASEDVARYKHVRKSSLQAFSHQNVSHWGPMLRNCLDKWKQETLNSSNSSEDDGVTIDIGESMQLLTVDIIGLVGFNYQLSSDQVATAVKSLQVAYLEFAQKSRKYPQRQLLGAWFYPEIRRAQEASLELQQLARTMLQEYRKTMNDNTTTATTSTDGKPILHYLVNDKAYKNDEERICDIVAFFAGGYDTTSYSLAWILLELAKNPDTQTWLRQELQRSKEFRDCVALKHCIREGMRLHPASAIGGLRRTVEDIVVDEGGNIMIPSGSITLTMNLALQRDGDIFENPDSFLPQRWEEATDEMNRNWVAFGTGRRSCVGQTLAQAELVMVIGTLISEYEWTVQKEGRVDFFVTLKTMGTLLNAKKIV